MFRGKKKILITSQYNQNLSLPTLIKRGHELAEFFTTFSKPKFSKFSKLKNFKI